MAIKNGFKYRVNFVKHRDVNGTPITSFSIGEKIRNTDPTEWQNYTVTVWQHIDLQNGDEVKLCNFRDIDASRGKDGRTFFSFSADIKEDDSTTTYAKPMQEPAVSKTVDDDSDCRLPFDI